MSDELDMTEAWNAYIDKFGYEPDDASHLQKFTKSSAGKHVQTLTSENARKVFSANKGKGKIGDSNEHNKPRLSLSRSNSRSNQRPKTPTLSRSNSRSNTRPKTPTLSRSNSRSKTPSLSPNGSRHRKSKSNLTVDTSAKSRSNPPSRGGSKTPTRRKSKSSSKSPTPSNNDKNSNRKRNSLSPADRRKSGSKKRASQSKKKPKEKEEPKEKEIRSKLNNDAKDSSLDSMLEILRRATLVKKQRKLEEEQRRKEMEELANRTNNQLETDEHGQQDENTEAAEPGLSAQAEPTKPRKKHSMYDDIDMTTTDLQEYTSKQQQYEQEQQQLFQTQVTSLEEININPLLLASGRVNKKYSMDAEQEDSNVDTYAFPLHHDVDDEEDENNMEYQPAMAANLSLDVIQDGKEVQAEDEEDDDGYESPPELFRDDVEWDWTDQDIVFAFALNYGLSLHLLHLGLSQGPLFPNSILKWTKMAFDENAPSARSGHVSAFVHDKMVIFGGTTKQLLTDHIFLVDVPKNFDVDTPLEVSAVSSSEKIHKTFRVGHSCVPLPNCKSLFLFGGWNDQQYVNDGLVFNVDSLKLVDLPTKDRILPPPRRDHTLCKMGASMLLFGGWSHDYDGNELWALASNWRWTELHDVEGTPPCPRRGHSASVIRSHMYIFGGLYGFTLYLNDLHRYDGTNNEWQELQLVGNTRPPPRAWHSSCIVGSSQILIFGGTSGRTNFLHDCWVFDTVGYFWFQVECHGNSPLPRCSHSMVNVYEDRKFMQEPFTNECIKIDKDGNVEDAQYQKDRLRLLMFGGLVAIDDDEKEKELEMKEQTQMTMKKKKKKGKHDETATGKQGGKQKKTKKGKKKKQGDRQFLDVVSSDLAKLRKKKEDAKNEEKKEKEKREESGEHDEDDGVDEEGALSSDSSSDDSDKEENGQGMSTVNRIELSDDLYVLQLHI